MLIPEKPKQTKEVSENEKRVLGTPASRDRVTMRLLSELIPANKSPRKFIVDACKFAKITPPKPSESLTSFVYKLQKQVCKFSEFDSSDGCDGKLGPITHAALLRKIPQLKLAYSKAVRAAKTAPYKARLKILGKSMGMPAPSKPSTPKKAPALRSLDVAQESPETISNQETVLIGDSLMEAGFGNYFYRGTRNFRKYRRRTFRSGRKIFDMAKRAEKYMPYAKAYVIGAAANDIYFGDVTQIEQAFKQIIAKAKEKNPNARIVLLTLHGEGCRGWRRHRSRTNEKIRDLNSRLRKIAQNDPKISLIDINSEIKNSQNQGHKVLKKDQLHYSMKGARAVSRLLKDELATGDHRRLTDYMA